MTRTDDCTSVGSSLLIAGLPALAGVRPHRVRAWRDLWRAVQYEAAAQVSPDESEHCCVAGLAISAQWCRRQAESCRRTATVLLADARNLDAGRCEFCPVQPQTAPCPVAVECKELLSR